MSRSTLSSNKLTSFLLIRSSIIVIIIFSIVYIANYSYAIENENITKNKNDFNIITVADVGCSPRAQENIKNIEKLDPDLFLVAGDLSYEKTADCWFNMTKSLDLKTKIAIGNHDDYEEEGSNGENLKQSVLDHYNLDKSYYSFDYQNVHVLVLDTQLELSVDTLESTAKIGEIATATTDTTADNNKYNKKENSKEKDKIKQEPLLEKYPLVNLNELLKQNSVENTEIPQLKKFMKSDAKVPSIKVDEDQYKFVLDDLENASKNKKDVDWIFVMFHKPMYSPLSKQFEEYIIREKYQSLFDKYGVDLVIQGHNHIYSRTLPLSFNEKNISQPMIDQESNNNNNNNNNNTFTM
jgi:3',5'-cyclic AMP phosphodiesterase CpdA